MNIILLITSVAYLFLNTSHFQFYEATGLEYEFISVSKELQISESTDPKEPNTKLEEIAFASTLFFPLFIAINEKLNLVKLKYFLLAVFYQSNYFQSYSYSS
ncbi:hypothetical protein ACFFHM_17940 [Halalkalibacter kiskunsagensis]|uniref:VanZ-like domain-containing protein n=1 Tax=Halalkalibacter kiskunsagensis TaxID=1548599 RepID=A0ABV6KJZ3_9BACI